MRENWKFWLAVLMVALAAGFGVMRFRRLVHEQAPAWLKLEHKAAESLPKPAWEHFKLVVKQTQTEADTRGLPFGSIQFVDLNDRTNEATWWTTERVVNQGFNPLTSLESSSQAGKDRFLGYYTLGGDSLSCEIKHHPSRPNWLILTVNLEQPLPPGASLVVVRVERRPVYLVFLARQPGAYHLLTGNDHCTAPNYDLAALGMNLKGVAVSSIKVPPPADNPDFHAPEVLPGLELTGAPLDISEWKFRKSVKISSGGAQQIELDLDVLAHAQPGFADLRVLHGSNQVPYIVERTSISRAIAPTVIATNDVKNPKLSQWVIKLPQSNLPLTRLTCVSPTALFERSLSLYEELTDERGDEYRHELGNASWTQMPEHKSKEFALNFDSPPQSDTFFLETENGDNPPIELEKFTAFYPATRILFKAKPDDELFLYYGNPRVSSPSYDLRLVAGQLLAAEKETASLSAEDQLKKSSWRENEVPGKGGFVFWGILAVVVVGLLVIISRVLPKS